jgi:hypothetical protein
MELGLCAQERPNTASNPYSLRPSVGASGRTPGWSALPLGKLTRGDVNANRSRISGVIIRKRVYLEE